MKILITGVCGFAGSVIATTLLSRKEGLEIRGLDNFIRPGSETNRLKLKGLGVTVVHGDVRSPSDFESLPDADWVIDAAANPSVLAGVDGRSTSRQLIEHNLQGTLNLLEYCRSRGSGLILLSSSRVYSIRTLNAIPIRADGDAFQFDAGRPCPPGATAEGLGESFSTEAPVSLYGSTKLASEVMALEYAETFGFPLWVNRCGILTGAGQMGTAEQGIFSFWIHAHAARLPLRFTGFEGMGKQVRDAFHPEDLALLLEAQMNDTAAGGTRLFNAGGGRENSMSLVELARWCDRRFGAHAVTADPEPRRFDIPWVVMDAARARERFGWSPRRKLRRILEEIAAHAEENPDWLRMTGAR